MSTYLCPVSAARAIRPSVEVEPEATLAWALGGVAGLVTTGTVTVTNGMRARAGVLRGTHAQIKDIQKVHRRMGAAASSADLAKFHELNLHFHALILEAAANARLREMDLAVRNEMQLCIRHNVSSEAQLRVSYGEHSARSNNIS